MTERKAELQAIMARIKADGGGAVLVTVTLRHHIGDKLAELLADLNDAWTRTKRGAPWGRFKERHGAIHDANALEATYGGNGWHPHKHVLLWLDHEPTEAERDRMEAWLSKRFIRMAAKVGRYASPAWGLTVRPGSEAAGYIAKWGAASELASPKDGHAQGQTPFELLAAARDGDERAARLFQEYAAAIKGRYQMRYSRSLKALRERLKIRREAEAAEAAAQADEVPPLMILDMMQFNTVAKQGKRGELLTVAATGDAELVWRYLETIGVMRAPGWERERAQAVAATDALGDRMLMREALDVLAAGDYVEVVA